MGWRPSACGAALLLAIVLTIVSFSPASASHAAYGTINWVRSAGFSQTNCGHATESQQKCAYDFELKVAIRLNYPKGSMCGVAELHTSSNCVGNFRAYRESGNNYKSVSAKVTPSYIDTSRNYYLGEGRYNNWEVRRGTSYVVWELCCRLSTLVGANRDDNSYVHTRIDTAYLASPTTTGTHRIFAQVNTDFRSRIPSAVSANGKVIQYTWAPITSYASTRRGSSGLTEQKPSGMTLDIDGNLFWRPTSAGLYAMQVHMNEGTMVGSSFTPETAIVLDFIIDVVTSCSNCNQPPYFHNLPLRWPFYRGIEGTLEITAMDPDGDSVTIIPATLPQGVTAVQTQGGSTAKMRVRWTPKLDSNPQVVCFQAFDSRGQGSLGQSCVNLDISNSHIIYVSGIIRDFKKSHPDFAIDCDSCDNGVKFVDNNLGGDDKPVFVSRAGLTSVTQFNQWFNDVPQTNMRMVHSLILSNGTVPDGRIYTFSTNEFWVIDDLLWGNEAETHNNYFTYEIRTYVVHQGGEFYEYRSADDLFVFVNRKMDPNWDLHGIHPGKSYTMNMDALSAGGWNLVLEEIYTCDIFFAHRSSRRSPALQIQLPNAVLCDALSSGVPSFNFNPFRQTTDQVQLTLIGRPKVVARPSGVPAHGPAGDMLQLIAANEFNDGGAVYFAELQQVGDDQVYVSSEQKVLQGFATTFDFVFHGYQGNGPEGFAFVFQADGPTARGNDGAGLGYHMLTRSVAVEFDTKYTAGMADPNYNHVSLHTRYEQPNSASEHYSLGVSNDDPPMRLANGTVHRIRIEYSPAKDDSQTSVKLGWVRVWMNSVLAPVMQAQVNDDQLRAALDGTGFVGFTVGSGAETQGGANILLYNWNLVIVPPSATQSGVVSLPLAMEAGGRRPNTYAEDRVVRSGQIVVQLRDSCGNIIPVGNEPWRFTVRLHRRVGGWDWLVPETDILPNGDGSYTITFNPDKLGYYDIDVRFDGLPILNNPFEVDVTSAVSSRQQSAIVFSRLPATASNAPFSSGLFVVAVDHQTGYPLSGAVSGVQQFDLAGVFNGVPRAPELITMLGALPASTAVAVACAASCPHGSNSALIAALDSIGCTQFAQIQPGDSYACIGQKGVSAAHTQQHSATSATEELTHFFVDTSAGGLNGFSITAVSGGQDFGLVSVGTSGGFAQVLVVPENVFVEAAVNTTFAVVSRDRFNNPQINHADTMDVYFDPDITLQGGSLSDQMIKGAGYIHMAFEHRVAGAYTLYAKMSNTELANRDVSNSPFELHVVAGPAHHETSVASGPGLNSARATIESCFELMLKDEFRNSLVTENLANPDHVRVRLSGPQILCAPEDTGSECDAPGVLRTVSHDWVGVPPNQQFQVCYTAQAAGTYDVRVWVNGEPMVDANNARTVVTPGPMYAPLCSASGQGLTSDDPAVAGLQGFFVVQSRDRAGNPVGIRSFPNLELSWDSSQTSPLIASDVSYDGQGRYRVSYTVNVAGTHQLTLSYPVPLCADSSLDECVDTAVERLLGNGQPLTVHVIPGAVSDRSRLLNVPSSLIAGQLATYNVEARDAFENLIVDGQQLSGFVHRIRTDPLVNAYVTVTPTLLPPLAGSEAMYRAQFRPTVAATFYLEVVTASDASAIQGVTVPIGSEPSGVAVTVSPAATDCSQFLFGGQGHFGGDAESPSDFTIQPRDEYLNPQVPTIKHEFTITLSSDQTTTVQTLPEWTGPEPPGPEDEYWLWDSDAGLARVNYITPSCGLSFKLEVQWNHGLSGTPVCMPWTRNVPCSVSGTINHARPECGYERARAGATHRFCVIDYMNLEPSPDYKTDSISFVVEITDTESDFIQPDVFVETGVPGATYNYSVSYLPTRIGNYSMSLLTVLSRQPATSQPFFLQVSPGAIYASNCRVIGLNQEAISTRSKVAGETHRFFVELRDEFNNLITREDLLPNVPTISADFGQLVDEASPPPVLTGTWFANNSMLYFDYTISRAGHRQVVVTSNGTPLMQGSHDLTIVHAAAAPEYSWADGGGISSATAGEFAYFDIRVRDRFNNPATRSAEGLLRAEFADDPEVDIQLTVTYKGNSVYGVSYNTQRSSVFGMAQNDLEPRFLQVLLGDEPIATLSAAQQPVTGYPVLVSPSRLSHELSELSDLAAVEHAAGQPVVFQFIAKDQFGNRWTRSGTRLVRVMGHFCVGENCDTGLSAGVDCSVTHLGYGEYTVELPGYQTQSAGRYQITINADGGVVRTPDPESARFTVVAAEAFPPNTQVPASVPDSLAGVHTSLIVSVRDQFNNLIKRTDPEDVQIRFIMGSYRCTVLGEGEAGSEITYSEDFEDVSVDYLGDGAYRIEFQSAVIGDYAVEVRVNNATLPCASTQRLNFLVTPGNGSPPHSTVVGPVVSVAGSTLTYVVTVRDAFGNRILRDIADPGCPPADDTESCEVVMGLQATSVEYPVPVEFGEPSTWLRDQTGVPEAHNRVYGVRYTGNADWQITVRPVFARSYPLVFTYNGGFISGTTNVTELVVEAAAPNGFSTPVFPTATAGRSVSLTLQALDVFDNPVSTHSHTYSVLFYRVGSGTAYEFNGQVLNNMDGRHTVTFLSEWAGVFNVRVSLIGGVSREFQIVVNHQTCGYDVLNPDLVSATPYRCPNDTCVASYEDCLGLDLCPTETPVRCGADSSCVEDASQCPCPTDQTRCPAGNCAATCPVLPPCPVGTQPCRNANGVVTGECRVNPETDCPVPRVCTPGLVLCDDGFTCANALADCEAPVSCSQVLCPSGACVSSRELCPTPVTCAEGQVQCAADGRCADSAMECLEQQQCVNSDYRCPDGSCRDSADQCPSLPVCPMGQLLCPNGRCASTAAECANAPAECPLNRVRCPDGSCVDNSQHCATPISCPPSAPILCADRSCASELAECQPAPSGCAAHLNCRADEFDLLVGRLCFQCHDGTCMLRSDEDEDGVPDFTCPTGLLCPPTAPVRCPTGDCATTAADCPSQLPCGPGSPVRCPNGACAQNLAECPSSAACPANMPVRCPDGRCSIAVEQCVDLELLDCPADMIRCAGGECAVAPSLCPTHVTCPVGSQKCMDGSCRPAVPGCPTDVFPCPPGQVTCPQASSGISCASLLADCPQTAACPPELPVLCLDRTCANTIANCPSVPGGLDNQHACPDGSWVSNPADCGTPVTCTPDRPYKCRDETCRKAPSDCPVAQAGTCSGSTPFMCPNGRCADSPYSAICEVMVNEQCPKELPVRCPDGHCVQSVSNCTALVEGCPHSLTLCRDGSCRTEDACAAPICPASLPHLCADGLCAEDASQCTLTNGCPPHSPHRCWEGTCVSDRSVQCPVRDADPCASKPGLPHFCDRVAMCVAHQDECIEYEDTGCADGQELMCLDGTCAARPGPGMPWECVSPVAGPNSCPINTPFRCPDGFCASSSLHCPPSVGGDDCPDTKYPIRCASGHCVTNSVQCPAVYECDVLSGMERCPDGSCRPANRCPITATCPTFTISLPGGDSETKQMVRCANGLCAATLDTCINPETGCPYDWVVCASGACAPDLSTCAAFDRPANGCPADEPVRCSYDGSCASTAADCPNHVGCPLESPFRCPNNGECVDDPDTCPTTPCTGIVCADGSCVASARDCRASNGCSVLTPVRCADGSCAQYSANSGMPAADSCPTGRVCDAGEILCQDGRCVPEGSGLCSVVSSCPVGLLRCPDQTCVTDITHCSRSECPPAAPVRCPSGLCKRTPGECSQDSHNSQICTAPTPMRCADGSCRASVVTCLEWLKEITESDTVEGICTAKVECPSYVEEPHNPDGSCNPVVCPDGSCAADKYLCAPISSCPPGQLRCADGSCVIAPAGAGPAQVCPKVAPCNAAQDFRRCEDGTCRKECLPYHGCGLDRPFHCANRECASRNDVRECISRRFAAPDWLLDTRFQDDTLPELPEASGAANVAVAVSVHQRTLLQEEQNDCPLEEERALQRFNTKPINVHTWNGPAVPCDSYRWRWTGEHWDPPGTPCTKNCMSQVRTATSAYSIDPDMDTALTVSTDSRKISRGTLVVPARAFATTSGKGALGIREVAESRLRSVANRVTYIRRSHGFGRYMGFSETLLSPAFECMTEKTAPETFRMNVTFRADYDRSRYPDLRDVCLGYVHRIQTGLFQGRQWRCVHGEHRSEAQAVVFGDDQSRLVSSFGKCGASGTIYGFIHSPVWLAIELPAQSTNWFAQNILWLVMGLVGFVVLSICGAYLLKRMRRYRKKYHEERHEVDRAQEEVDTMTQFGGRAGTKDDEVAMTDNPLVTQMEDMQKRLDDNAMEIQQAQLEEQQMESEERQDHIYRLKDDRNDLQDELERLKAQLNESTAANQLGGGGMQYGDASGFTTAAEGGPAQGQRRTELSAAGGRRQRDI